MEGQSVNPARSVSLKRRILGTAAKGIMETQLLFKRALNLKVGRVDLPGLLRHCTPGERLQGRNVCRSTVCFVVLVPTHVGSV